LAAGEDRDSANHMLPACKRFGTGSNEPPFWGAFDQGECIGTVKTVAFLAGTMNLSVLALSGEGQVIALKRNWSCADIPDGVTVGQELRVVIRYIEARPNRMHEPFRSLALEALLDAWPCRN
jgi:hypothetical protein